MYICLEHIIQQFTLIYYQSYEETGSVFRTLGHNWDGGHL